MYEFRLRRRGICLPSLPFTGSGGALYVELLLSSLTMGRTWKWWRFIGSRISTALIRAAKGPSIYFINLESFRNSLRATVDTIMRTLPNCYRGCCKSPNRHGMFKYTAQASSPPVWSFNRPAQQLYTIPACSRRPRRKPARAGSGENVRTSVLLGRVHPDLAAP